MCVEGRIVELPRVDLLNPDPVPLLAVPGRVQTRVHGVSPQGAPRSQCVRGDAYCTFRFTLRPLCGPRARARAASRSPLSPLRAPTSTQANKKPEKQGWDDTRVAYKAAIDCPDRFKPYHNPDLCHTCLAMHAKSEAASGGDRYSITFGRGDTVKGRFRFQNRPEVPRGQDLERRRRRLMKKDPTTAIASMASDYRQRALNYKERAGNDFPEVGRYVKVLLNAKGSRRVWIPARINTCTQLRGTTQYWLRVDYDDGHEERLPWPSADVKLVPKGEMKDVTLFTDAVRSLRLPAIDDDAEANLELPAIEGPADAPQEPPPDRTNLAVMLSANKDPKAVNIETAKFRIKVVNLKPKRKPNTKPRPLPPREREPPAGNRGARERTRRRTSMKAEIPEGVTPAQLMREARAARRAARKPLDTGAKKRKRKKRVVVRRNPDDPESDHSVVSEFEDDNFGEVLGEKGKHKVVRVNLNNFTRDLREDVKREMRDDLVKLELQKKDFEESKEEQQRKLEDAERAVQEIVREKERTRYMLQEQEETVLEAPTLDETEAGEGKGAAVGAAGPSATVARANRRPRRRKKGGKVGEPITVADLNPELLEGAPEEAVALIENIQSEADQVLREVHEEAAKRMKQIQQKAEQQMRDARELAVEEKVGAAKIEQKLQEEFKEANKRLLEKQEERRKASEALRKKIADLERKQVEQQEKLRKQQAQLFEEAQVARNETDQIIKREKYLQDNLVEIERRKHTEIERRHEELMRRRRAEEKHERERIRLKQERIEREEQKMQLLALSARGEGPAWVEAEANAAADSCTLLSAAWAAEFREYYGAGGAGADDSLEFWLSVESMRAWWYTKGKGMPERKLKLTLTVKDIWSRFFSRDKEVGVKVPEREVERMRQRASDQLDVDFFNRAQEIVMRTTILPAFQEFYVGKKRAAKLDKEPQFAVAAAACYSRTSLLLFLGTDFGFSLFEQYLFASGALPVQALLVTCYALRARLRQQGADQAFEQGVAWLPGLVQRAEMYTGLPLNPFALMEALNAGTGLKVYDEQSLSLLLINVENYLMQRQWSQYTKGFFGKHLQRTSSAQPLLVASLTRTSHYIRAVGATTGNGASGSEARRAIGFWVALRELGRTYRPPRDDTGHEMKRPASSTLTLPELHMGALLDRLRIPQQKECLAAVRACVDSGGVERAEYWTQRLERECGIGEEYNVILRNEMLRGFAERGCVWRAQQALWEMEAKGLRPNIDTFNVVLGAYAAAGEVAIAARADREGREDIRPAADSITVGAAIEACANMSDPVGAERWFEVYSSLGFDPTTQLYNAVIDAWADLGETERAEQWFDTLSNAEDEDVNVDARSHGALARAFLRATERKRAREWVDTIVKKTIKSLTGCTWTKYRKYNPETNKKYKAEREALRAAIDPAHAGRAEELIRKFLAECKLAHTPKRSGWGFMKNIGKVAIAEQKAKEDAETPVFTDMAATAKKILKQVKSINAACRAKPVKDAMREDGYWGKDRFRIPPLTRAIRSTLEGARERRDLITVQALLAMVREGKIELESRPATLVFLASVYDYESGNLRRDLARAGVSPTPDDFRLAVDLAKQKGEGIAAITLVGTMVQSGKLAEANEAKVYDAVLIAAGGYAAADDYLLNVQRAAKALAKHDRSMLFADDDEEGIFEPSPLDEFKQFDLGGDEDCGYCPMTLGAPGCAEKVVNGVCVECLHPFPDRSGGARAAQLKARKAAFAAVIRSGDNYTMAWKYVEAAKAAGVELSPVEYKATVKACARAGEAKEVIAVVLRMQKLNIELDEELFKLALEVVGGTSEAVPFLKRFIEAGVKFDPATVDCVMRAYCAAGGCVDVAKWLTVFPQLIEGYKPTYSNYLTAVQSLVPPTRRSTLVRSSTITDAKRSSTIGGGDDDDDMEEIGDPMEVLSMMQKAKVAVDEKLFEAVLETFDGPENARECFAEMKERHIYTNSRMFNMLIEHFAGRGDKKLADEWVELMRYSGHDPERESFYGSLDDSAKRMNHLLSTQLLKSIAVAKVAPDPQALVDEVERRLKAGEAVAAEDLLEKCKGMRLPIKIYDMMVSNYVENEEGRRAVTWLLDKYDAGYLPEREQWRSVIYGTYVKKLQARNALDALEGMRKQQLKPNMKFFNEIAKRMCESGDLPKAEMWLAELLRVGHDPEATGYNAVIRAHAQSSPSQAIEWLRKMQELDLVPYDCWDDMLNGCSNTLDTKLACEIIAIAHDEGGDPDVGLVTEELVDQGEYDAATRWLTGMKEHGCPQGLDVYVRALNVCSDASYAEVLLQALMEDDMFPDRETYEALLVGSGGYLKTPVYLGIIRRAGLETEIAAWEAILKDCNKYNDLALSVKWLEEARRHTLLTLPCFDYVLAVCYQKGEVRTLERLLRDMEALDGVTLELKHINMLLKLMAKNGEGELAGALVGRLLDLHPPDAEQRVAGAERILSRMAEARAAPDTTSFEAMIRVYAGSGEAKRAGLVVELMEKSGQQPPLAVYNQLVRACAEARDPAAAELMVGAIKRRDATPDVETFRFLIDAYAAGKALNKENLLEALRNAEHAGGGAQEYLATARALANHTDGQGAVELLHILTDIKVHPEPRLLRQVMRAAARIGDAETCKTLLEQLYKEGKDNVDTHCINYLLEACARLRDREGALAVMEHMQRTNVRPNKLSFDMLARACAGAEEFDEADIYAEISKRLPHVGNLELIAVPPVPEVVPTSETEAAARDAYLTLRRDDVRTVFLGAPDQAETGMGSYESSRLTDAIADGDDAFAANFLASFATTIFEEKVEQVLSAYHASFAFRETEGEYLDACMADPDDGLSLFVLSKEAAASFTGYCQSNKLGDVARVILGKDDEEKDPDLTLAVVPDEEQREELKQLRAALLESTGVEFSGGDLEAVEGAVKRWAAKEVWPQYLQSEAAQKFRRKLQEGVLHRDPSLDPEKFEQARARGKLIQYLKKRVRPEIAAAQLRGVQRQRQRVEQELLTAEATGDTLGQAKARHNIESLETMERNAKNKVAAYKEVEAAISHKFRAKALVRNAGDSVTQDEIDYLKALTAEAEDRLEGAIACIAANKKVATVNEHVARVRELKDEELLSQELVERAQGVLKANETAEAALLKVQKALELLLVDRETKSDESTIRASTQRVQARRGEYKASLMAVEAATRVQESLEKIIGLRKRERELAESTSAETKDKSAVEALEAVRAQEQEEEEVSSHLAEVQATQAKQYKALVEFNLSKQLARQRGTTAGRKEAANRRNRLEELQAKYDEQRQERLRIERENNRVLEEMKAKEEAKEKQFLKERAIAVPPLMIKEPELEMALAIEPDDAKASSAREARKKKLEELRKKRKKRRKQTMSKHTQELQTKIQEAREREQKLKEALAKQREHYERVIQTLQTSGGDDESQAEAKAQAEKEREELERLEAVAKRQAEQTKLVVDEGRKRAEALVQEEKAADARFEEGVELAAKVAQISSDEIKQVDASLKAQLVGEIKEDMEDKLYAVAELEETYRERYNAQKVLYEKLVDKLKASGRNPDEDTEAAVERARLLETQALFDAQRETRKKQEAENQKRLAALLAKEKENEEQFLRDAIFARARKLQADQTQMIKDPELLLTIALEGAAETDDARQRRESKLDALRKRRAARRAQNMASAKKEAAESASQANIEADTYRRKYEEQKRLFDELQKKLSEGGSDPSESTEAEAERKRLAEMEAEYAKKRAEAKRREEESKAKIAEMQKKEVEAEAQFMREMAFAQSQMAARDQTQMVKDPDIQLALKIEPDAKVAKDAQKERKARLAALKARREARRKERISGMRREIASESDEAKNREEELHRKLEEQQAAYRKLKARLKQVGVDPDSSAEAMSEKERLEASQKYYDEQRRERERLEAANKEKLKQMVEREQEKEKKFLHEMSIAQRRVASPEDNIKEAQITLSVGIDEGDAASAADKRRARLEALRRKREARKQSRNSVLDDYAKRLREMERRAQEAEERLQARLTSEQEAFNEQDAEAEAAAADGQDNPDSEIDVQERAEQAKAALREAMAESEKAREALADASDGKAQIEFSESVQVNVEELAPTLEENEDDLGAAPEAAAEPDELKALEAKVAARSAADAEEERAWRKRADKERQELADMRAKLEDERKQLFSKTKKVIADTLAMLMSQQGKDSQAMAFLQQQFGIASNPPQQSEVKSVTPILAEGNDDEDEDEDVPPEPGSPEEAADALSPEDKRFVVDFVLAPDEEAAYCPLTLGSPVCKDRVVAGQCRRCQTRVYGEMSSIEKKVEEEGVKNARQRTLAQAFRVIASEVARQRAERFKAKLHVLLRRWVNVAVMSGSGEEDQAKEQNEGVNRSFFTFKGPKRANTKTKAPKRTKSRFAWFGSRG